MGKVCIISAVDLSRMTMVSVYTDYLETHGIAYDIIYVDKYKDKSPFKASSLIAYNVDRYANSILPVKFMHFWKMRDFLRSALKSGNYDFAIVWGELAAFLFSDILKKMMYKKYCLNIRDYFYNEVLPVRARLKEAVLGASFCTVSSDAYLKYLPPEGNYIFLHSLNKKIISSLKPRTSLRGKDEPIRILYIGLIARLPYAYKLIDELGNDTRFELIFAGIGSENIDKYIENKNYGNVITYGSFPQSETAAYLEKADILYNLYGYGNKHFDTALSIKLYYAIYMHLPIMVFEGTQTKETAQECGLAFTLNGSDYSGIGDRLYNYYHSLNLTEISEKCDNYMNKINDSHLQLKRYLDNVLADEGEKNK
ncbi:MAG: hypothetical protein J6N52_04845 [Clostridia bacterium]|nr:hypothetical protein [Clostridia bacterium]